MLLVASSKATCFLYDAAAKSYVNKGSVGVVVVKEASNRHFQLITYYTPQNQLAVVDLVPAFQFVLQADGYGTFTSAAGQTWSLKFASVDAANDFAQFVAIGKAASGGYRELITQDLVEGRGNQVKDGNIVGMNFTTWLVSENKLSKQIETNVGTQKVKKVVLGNDRGVVAGWHQAIVGMKKGGVRFAVIPPSLAFGNEGSRPNVPPGAVLAVKLELVGVKKAEAAAVAGATAQVLPDTDASNRGQIIDRMKNIAVQAWPGSATPTKDDRSYGADDSAEDNAGGSVIGSDAVAIYQPASGPANEMKEQMEAMKQQMEKMKQEAEIERRVREAEEKAREAERKAREAEERSRVQQPQPMAMAAPTQLVQTPYGFIQQPVQQQIQQQHMPMMASHSNTQATGKDAVELYIESKEWRKTMDHVLSNINSKVEIVHSRIENSFLGAKVSNEESLSGGNLIKSLRRLIDENDTRGAELAEKNERLDSLRSTIATLHEKNEKLLDERNKLLEHRNDAVRETTDASRKQLDGLRGEKEKLESELLVTQDKLSKSKRKYASQVRTYETVKAELEMVKDELIKAKEEVARLTSSKTSQGVELDDVKAQLKKERDARRTIELERQRLAELLEEEQEATKRLQASIDARKTGYEDQKERMEKLAAEEKEALRKEIAQLNEQLRTDRLASAALGAEHKRVVDALTAKHSEELKREVASGKESTKRDVETRLLAEKAEAVKAADEKARNETRAKFLAENPLGPELTELKAKLSGVQQEKEVLVARATLAEKNAQLAIAQARSAAVVAPSATNNISNSNNASSEVEVSKKIVAQTKAVMSKVYYVVQQSIPAEQSIVGKEVHTRVLACIKTVTTQVLAPLEAQIAAAPVVPAPVATSSTPSPGPVSATTTPPPTQTTTTATATTAVAAPVAATTTTPVTAQVPVKVAEEKTVVAEVVPQAVGPNVPPTLVTGVIIPGPSVVVEKAPVIDPLRSEKLTVVVDPLRKASASSFVDPLSDRKESASVTTVNVVTGGEQSALEKSESVKGADAASSDVGETVQSVRVDEPRAEEEQPSPKTSPQTERIAVVPYVASHVKSEQAVPSEGEVAEEEQPPVAENTVSASQENAGDESWDESDDEASEAQPTATETTLPLPPSVTDMSQKEEEREVAEEKKEQEEVGEQQQQQHQQEQQDEEKQEQQQQEQQQEQEQEELKPEEAGQEQPQDQQEEVEEAEQRDSLPAKPVSAEEKVESPLAAVAEVKKTEEPPTTTTETIKAVPFDAKSLSFDGVKLNTSTGSTGFFDDLPSSLSASSSSATKPPGSNSKVSTALWGDDDDTVPAPAPPPARPVAVKENFSSLFNDDEDLVVTPTKPAEPKKDTPGSKSRAALFSDDEGDANFANTKPKQPAIDDSLFKF